jgi:hypothetical protein
MPPLAANGESSNYVARLSALVWRSMVQLLGPASHPRAAEAARRRMRHSLLLIALGALVVVTLMYVLDVPEIGLMPPRGTAGLWPVGIVTSFGKAAFVVWPLAIMSLAVAVVSPHLRGPPEPCGCALACESSLCFSPCWCRCLPARS